MAILEYDPVVSEYYESGFKAESREELTYVFAYLFDYNVVNGGFHQLFYNMDSDDLEKMADALAELKLCQSSALLRFGIDVVGEKGTSTDWTVRQEFLEIHKEIFHDSLNKLNERYWDHHEEESFSETLRAYVIEHGDAFKKYGDDFARGKWE